MAAYVASKVHHNNNNNNIVIIIVILMSLNVKLCILNYYGGLVVVRGSDL